jgi:type II secretion system protein G
MIRFRPPLPAGDQPQEDLRVKKFPSSTTGGRMPLREPRNAAFTLIELLIVVAIIAVLAGIAVPKFLEAQSRSKVSRMKADMRSIATALESYAVDFNTYPAPSNENGGIILSSAPIDWYRTRIPKILTTPVVYIASMPDDVFFGEHGETELIHYSTRDYAVAAEGNDLSFLALTEQMIGPAAGIEYYVLSHGPDLDHDFATVSGGAGSETIDSPDPAPYDPTNGAVSNGDVVYWGPSRGYLE